jgi:hypothetical protein
MAFLRRKGWGNKLPWSRTPARKSKIKNFPKAASPRATYFVFTIFPHGAPFGRNRIGHTQMEG